MVVRYTEYVIGVISGKYKPPYPLATSIRRKSVHNFLNNKVRNQYNTTSYFNEDRHEFIKR